jgi:hypothetical protein
MCVSRPKKLSFKNVEQKQEMIFEIFRIFEWTLNLKIIFMSLLKAFFSTSVSIFLNLTLTNSFVRFFVVINFEYILFYLS